MIYLGIAGICGAVVNMGFALMEKDRQRTLAWGVAALWAIAYVVRLSK